MLNEHQFRSELQKSLSAIDVPGSLYRFAKDVPALCKDEQKAAATYRPRNKWQWRTAAAIVLLAGTVSIGAFVSPVLAAFMKDVPGFEIAVDWLHRLRAEDGVQVALENGYTPIEAKTAQFGGTTVTISDIYLTDEELLFKAFIRTDEYDVTDGRSRVRIEVVPVNIRGGGSTTGASIAETADGSLGPVLQFSYKFQLSEHAAREFLAREKELQFEVRKFTFHHEPKRLEIEHMGTIAVSVDPNKLLHNRVYEPNQALPITAYDPDWKELTLEKLTIQPTTMNAILSGHSGWVLDFPREEGAPYLKDEKGNIYKYDPSGPALMLEEGKQQLPFSSSVFFDQDIARLQLHIGTVFVTEKEPSGSFELSKNDAYPKTVRFKNRTIEIGEVEFQDGYIRLKIKKESPDQNVLDGIRFFIAEYDNELASNKELETNLNALREQLQIEHWEVAVSRDADSPYLDLYIPALPRDRHTISLQRVNDKMVVNQDYWIDL